MAVASQEDATTLSVYIGEGFKKEIRVEAANNSMSMSEFVRHVLRAGVEASRKRRTK